MRSAIFNLGLATAFNFAVAILPYWYKGNNDVSSLDRLFGIIDYLKVDLNMYFDGTLHIFIFPLMAGIASLLAMMILFFTKRNFKVSKNVIIAPIIIVLCILGYELVVQKDIHIISISLVALIPAWWSYNKKGELLKHT